MIKRLPNPTRWASIPVAALEDARLSWKARGLLAFILAKPDDWEIRRDNLIAASGKDGETSVKSALKELVDAGYAELVTMRQEDSTQVAGKRYEVSDYPRVENPIMGSSHDGKTTSITYKPEETKDQKKDLLPKRTQNACVREETASLSFEHGEDKDRLATGEDIVFPESHGCMQYHPGLPCEHEQEVLSAVRGVLWPDRATLPKSHLSVRAFAHRYHESLERVGAACKLAEWWKKTRKPRDWTIPLMFADPETELANAQSVPAPGGETARERYARKLQEQGG